MKLPNEDLEFGWWFYRVKKDDERGILKVEVVHNTYHPKWPDDKETIGCVDMGSWRAEKKLHKLKKRASRKAHHYNLAKRKAQKYGGQNYAY